VLIHQPVVTHPPKYPSTPRAGFPLRDLSQWGTCWGLKTYFVQGETTRLIKIGRSVDPYARMKDLQKGSPDTLRMLAILDQDYEGELHLKFSQHRVRDEWFRPAPELLAFVESLKNDVP
jgi:hypothetical protein